MYERSRLFLVSSSEMPSAGGSSDLYSDGSDEVAEVSESAKFDSRAGIEMSPMATMCLTSTTLLVHVEIYCRCRKIVSRVDFFI